jgi:hypothetical protein
MRKQIYIVVGVTMALLLGLVACDQYDWEPPTWDYYENESPNPVRPRPIVYDDHVAPLFSKYSCDGCHNGQIPPDLRPASSESELISGYIDETDAENSLVVQQINDDGHGGTWNDKDLFTLLDWIYVETQLK